MEHHNPSSTSDATSQVRIPIAVWTVIAAFVAALIAILVFKVAVGTVVTYGFLGLMVLSHFLMHGGHGSHGPHTNQTISRHGEGVKTDKDNPLAGRGGCH